MRRMVMLGSVLFFSACQSDSAVIADLEQDKVVVQVTGSNYGLADLEARRGCQWHGKVPSSRISKMCLGQTCDTARVLYACTDGEHGVALGQVAPGLIAAGQFAPGQYAFEAHLPKEAIGE